MVLGSRAGHAQMATRDVSNYIFVAARTRAEVSVIDSQTDILVGRIALSGIPDQMLTLDKGARLVVADAAAHQVQMIDVTSGGNEYSWAVPLAPRVLGANKVGNKLVALDPDAGKVALMQVSGGSPASIVDLAGARYATFDPRGRLLVAHDANVAVIDATGQHSGELIADPADGPITHLATDPGGEYVFVVQDESGVLSIFDLHKETRAAVLRLPAPLGRVVPSADSQFVLLPVGGHAVSIISNWTL